MPSKIEWTDETWNPVIGCSKISEGCRNCYAERMAYRLANMDVPGYADVVGIFDREHPETYWTGKTAFVESALEKPLHWRKPRRVFVCSMGDLFHSDVNIRGNEVRSIFRVMASTHHTYFILTKRPERMAECINFLYGSGLPEVAPNIWLGVTAESQEAAEERVPALLEIPAAVRFVSVEPMLGPISLAGLQIGEQYLDALTGDFSDSCAEPGDAPSIDWVICGGETGPGARPMEIEWVRDLQRQCGETNTPFFFKKWSSGGYKYDADGMIDGVMRREWPVAI